MSEIGLAIGLSGLDADQQGLDLIGQNIANAGTPGYVDEELDLSTIGDSGATGDQAGVKVAGIARESDTLLQGQLLDAQSNAQSLSTVSTALSTIQAQFPEPAGSGAFSSQLASFWSDWTAVANDPGNSSTRSALLDQGQVVATDLNQLSAGIGQVATDASDELTSSVSTVNSLASQIAALNGQIVASGAGTLQPDPGLEDQRDQLLSQLSQQVTIQVTPQADGSDTITAGNGTLVDHTAAQQLQVASSGTSTTLQWPGGTPATASGGTIGGLMTLLTSTVPTQLAGLNNVAATLIGSVNAAQAQGYDLTGNAGQPFFSGTTAGDIAVALTDPDGVAAASTTVGSGSSGTAADNIDGSNAALIAELGTGPITYGTGATATVLASPTNTYSTFVSDLGSTVAQTQTQVTSANQLVTSTTSSYEAQTGVDTNQALTEMVQYQNSYEAAAQYINTVNQTLSALISIL